MLLLLLLLTLLTASKCSRLGGYRVWVSDTHAHVDLYAPATIAISWTTPNNSVYGYFFHLDSLSASSTFLLGVRVCKPYTVVKWHEGQAAILNGACAENGVNWRRNASLLLEGQRLFLPFNGERISAIRRDPTSRRIYVYKPPVLYVYSPDTYERITAYRMPELRDFYVSRSSIFYIVGTKVRVYNEREAQHYTLGEDDAPRGEFVRYRLYDANLMTHSSAQSLLPLFTMTALVLALVLY